MMSKRKRYSAEFKFKVALEAAKSTKTINQLASEYELHPSQISQWKHQLLEEGATVFANQSVMHQQREQQKLQSKLYEEIGRLKVELEWLKKKAARYS